MPIREKGYYNWQGTLKESRFKWLPIFSFGIKKVFRKKKSKLIFSFASFPFVLFLGIVYILSKPESRIFSHIIKELHLHSDPYLFKNFLTFGPLQFGLIVLSVFAGAHLIAEDIKYKSLNLYLGRPLSLWDYIQGKLAIVLFYLLLFSLVPVSILIFARIIFSGQISIPIHVLFASIVFPILISLFYSSFILMLSSFSTNIKFVVITFFAIGFMTNALGNIFQEIFHNDTFYLLTFEKNIDQTAVFLFNTTNSIKVVPAISFFIILFLTGLFFLVLTFRLKKLEV